jgi:hypothetical protein
MQRGKIDLQDTATWLRDEFRRRRWREFRCCAADDEFQDIVRYDRESRLDPDEEGWG